jgi:uncharacterized DUF497 family protein
MTNTLEIADLEWDSWNEELITRHGVTIDGILAALRNILLVKPSSKDRCVASGTGLTGRIIAVVVGEVPNTPNIFQVFSAGPANRRERRALQQDRGT